MDGTPDDTGPDGDGGTHVTATEADILRWDAEVAQLNEALAQKEDLYIIALEGRDREAALQLEEELQLMKAKKERIEGVLARKVEELKLRNSAGAALVALVYTSRATRGMTSEDVAQITARSVTRNKILGVTGVLMFSVSSGQYLQILEGAQDCITNLFNTIKRDKRHTDVVLIRQQRLDARQFPEWPMYSMDLIDYDLPERPLQFAFNMLSQNNAIATRCSQKCMRDVLQKGGNPHFIQPKRMKVVAMVVELHHRSAFTELDINPCSVADVFNTFDDLVIRGVEQFGGTVVSSRAGQVHCQWAYNQLGQAKDAMEYLIDLFAELRSISTLPEGATAARLAERPTSRLRGSDVPFGMGGHKKATNADGASFVLPDVPLCALCYPCIAITCGPVFLTVLSKHQSSVNVVGPAFTEAARMVDAAVAASRQIVMSPQVKTRLQAYLQPHHLEDVNPLNAKSFVDVYHTFKEVPAVPADVQDSLLMLTAELTDQGGVHALSPEVLNALNAENEAASGADADMVGKAALSSGGGAKAVQAAAKSTMLPVFQPPPPKSFSTRVCLGEEELRAQFDIIDVQRTGVVTGEAIVEYFNKFDSMGIDATAKRLCTLTAHRSNISYDEFSILMLQMAQD